MVPSVSLPVCNEAHPYLWLVTTWESTHRDAIERHVLYPFCVYFVGFKEAETVV